jgi:hypothetical protein
MYILNSQNDFMDIYGLFYFSFIINKSNMFCYFHKYDSHRIYLKIWMNIILIKMMEFWTFFFTSSSCIYLLS